VALSSPARGAAPASPGREPAPSPRLQREAILVGLAAFCAYALTLSAVPALTHDSLTYLEAIERGGSGLFHPHHLAYNALARGWLDLAGAVGVTTDPLRVVAILDAVLGAVAAGLVWLVLRLRAALPRSLAAAGTAGAALSFGMWFYSVSVEVYLLPLALLLATFVVLSAPTLSVRRMAVVGALNGLAVLGHQVNVLFALVVLAAAVHHVDRATALRRMAAYAGAATAIVAAAYAGVLAFVVRPGSIGEARGWFTSYAGSGTYWELGPTAPVKAAVGFTRSVVGGHFSFRLDWVRERMLSAFPDRSLDDEAFLVRQVPSAAAWTLTILAGLAMASLAVALVRGVRRRDRLPETARRVARLLGAWFAVYGAFFLFWEPVNLEFWIPQATVMWMVVATLWAPAEPERAAGRASLPRGAVWLGLTAGAVAAVSLIGTILPATDSQNDVYALRYSELADLVDEGDLVIVENPHLGVPYTNRHTDADALSIPRYASSIEVEEVDEPSPTELVGTMDETLADGATVVVDALLLTRPDNDRSRALGVEIEAHYGDRLRPVEVPGAAGWLLIDAP
jgi:hypothetical protein